MSLSVLFSVTILGFVMWQGRHLFGTSGRQRWILLLRLGATAFVCLGLWLRPHPRVQQEFRQVMYVVDRSDSIDPHQRAWMARRIASLEALRPAGMPRTVLTFGRQAQTAIPWGQRPLTNVDEIEHALKAAPMASDHTNLEDAVLSAMTVAGSHGQRTGQASIILLTDGRETTGDALRAVSALRAHGLRIFPAAPPMSEETSAVWDDVMVPPIAAQGAGVPVQLVLFNASHQSKVAELTVALRGVVVKRQTVQLQPGWHIASLSVPAIQRGTMALDVGLRIPADHLDEHRQVFTNVEGPPSVLWVTDHPAALAPVAAVLKRHEMNVAHVRPKDLVAGHLTLADYDAVVLSNVPKSAFTDAQVADLQQYVTTHGGGLVMIGLGGDLAQEINHVAPLDALLPVVFQPKGVQESKRRICVVMLIDRSQSMFGPRIAATKRAAVALVKQLLPEDLVGVLAFDTEPYVIVEVQPAGQVSTSLIDKLVKLRAIGGTDVYPALAAAANRLQVTGATAKHIILLSDGNTPFAELRQSYEAMFRAFRQEHITVSTIGIGSAFINTDYLRYVAQQTDGAFYSLQSLDELPRLIARDTQHMLDRLPFTEGVFPTHRVLDSEWFAEIRDWPSLRGYLTSTPKPQARVDVTVSGGGGTEEPLMVRWNVGRGRVVSFLSDADARWSSEWVRWPAFDPVWTHVLRWAMRPQHNEEIFLWTDESRQPPQLVIEGALTNPQVSLTADTGTDRIPVSLVQTGPWRWEAALEHMPSGWHRVVIESAEAEMSRWIRLGSPTTSGELTGQPPDETLLRQLAQATNGSENALDLAFIPMTGPVTTFVPVFTWWLPMAIVALLLEIWLRGSSML